MKIKVTEKAIRESYKNIIKVGYCEMQYLLNYARESYYTCNRDGWKADFYEIDYDTIISTGYSPIGNKHIDYKELRKLEEEAQKIRYNYSLSSDDQKKQINNLLMQAVAMAK